MRYDHKQIEAKWQQYWRKNKTFKVEIDLNKPKYYVLDMFPYPSGAGLHVGHVEGYTATDIVARHKRQLGFNVLHPMGWDSFGLPAEQYAMRTGTHPAITTKNNIDNFRRQLELLGFSYDWDREITTSQKTYYKWTQWIFTLLYERGLAYEAEMMVNYCPALGTVLANEEVDNGRSKEGSHPIERRPLRQWVLRITAYADRLLADLDLLDWPESLKKLQANWIGRSEGATIDFSVKDHPNTIITSFTTRPDTIFGATYLVIAPDHPLVASLTSELQRPVVRAYLKAAAAKSDLDRTDLSKEKTGVFLGAFAINPVNGVLLPIWVADYVFMGYGTGAIMAVPAHDERDFLFAKEYALPILPVFEPKCPQDPALLEDGDTLEEICNAIHLGLRCWSGPGRAINSSSTEISLNGLDLPAAKQTIIAWLEQKKIGRKCVNYKLRDWLFSRQRYWGEPIPILHFADGTKRALELDELPLTPPELSDYKPAGDGNSPMAKVREWVETVDPKTGKYVLRETNTMPQWAGSCWYYLRFCDPHNSEQAWSPDAEKYWLPVDLYVGGVEHAVLHLLYARFWHKVLYDCGLVSTLEPFYKLRNQGLVVSRSYKTDSGVYIAHEDVHMGTDGRYYHRQGGEPLQSQVEKMSKSKLNGVTPDEIIEEFGADSLRLYEMFMGPLEKEKIWNTDAVGGCRRFLDRFYQMAQSEKLSDIETPEALKLGYRLIDGVAKDIAALQFNTAIAKMMEFMNDFTKLPSYPRSVVRMAIQALMPFAPHLAEEAWQMLESDGVLAHLPYPEIDATYLEEETATYIVQVNGKLRGRFELPKDQTQEVILSLARQDPNVSRHIQECTIVKVIFVPNKLLNIVVE